MESLKLNARVDANAKNEQFCNSVGNNVSTVVNKAVLREQKLHFDGETVYEKLKEAELKMSNTQERYSKEEVLESMNNIIG